ncbi:uncharacterized protein B0H18DRAFT_988004 [Fomitopsis serialis]|uniref:uncharacterized protein n=1 Tax=Fomitopsis serialis TaxID=139415 RepID=UPI002008D4F9|nr:uncharacterized protein B0H18DRAFT_988004 [Neoantrodia serialis]KAH9931783.1 hypothetical protein B0H18DRAFT_988004 [Neoantrodia serialis]
MRWYGIGIEVDGKVTEGPQRDIEAQHRVLSHPRSLLSSLASPRLPQSEFMGKIRSTARIVSDKYKRSLGKRPRRLVIGKPTLVATTDHRVSARMGVPPVASHPAPIPFEDMNLSHYAPSGIRASRVNYSTRDNASAAPSIRSSSTSNGSIRTHEVEAVVHTAARATSVRSGYSAASADGQKTPDMNRPRLVPFTSASRVPVPKLPSPSTWTRLCSTKRVASQMAKIIRGAAGMEKRAPVNDKVHYVHALGDDTQSAASGSIGNSPTGTFSVESSQHGHDAARCEMLARTGEQFKFRVPVSYSAGSPLTSARALPQAEDPRGAAHEGKPLHGS